VGVEGEEELTRALRYLKEVKGLNPEIIVHDFFAPDCKAVTNVFGQDKSAIDPFHVMQLLNRAIRKDLSRFCKQRCGAELRDLQKLTTFVGLLQATLKTTSQIALSSLPVLPTVEKGIGIASMCEKITRKVLPLLQIVDSALFFSELRKILAELSQESNLLIKAFVLALEAKLPKHALTPKAHHRMATELLKKLKKMYVEARTPLEMEQTKFNRRKWALFYQPNRLTPERATLILNFLTRYPALQSYRDLTLSVGSIYRLPLEFVKDQLIDELIIRPEWGEELKTAITTIKKHKEEILRFREFFQRHPTFPKRCRANTEYLNPLFKAIFRTGKYLKGWGRLENEIEMQLGGEVRNFISTL